MFSPSYIKKCKALRINPLIQDDLVKSCKSLPKYKNKTYLQLLSYFRIGISKMYCESYLETQTLNDLWLMFYMKEKGNQIWYEEKNKWL